MGLLQTFKKKGDNGGGVSRYILALMVLGCFLYVYADTGVTGRKGGPLDAPLTQLATAGGAEQQHAAGGKLAAAAGLHEEQDPVAAGAADVDVDDEAADAANDAGAGAATATQQTQQQQKQQVPKPAATAAITTSAASAGAAAEGDKATSAAAKIPTPAGTTRAGGLFITEQCNSEDSEAMAWQFRNLTKDVPFWTACSSGAWLDKFHAISPTGPKVFMDVGCNKGYTSAHFFALWAPEVGFKPSEIPKRRPGHLCGTCADCNEEPVSKVQASSGPITVYCVEPSMRNFANLIQVRDTFFDEKTNQDLQWYIMNAAMSNDTKWIKFPRGCKDELCSLDGQSDGKKLNSYDWIPLETVDHFVKQYEVPKIDVLKIDTEGYDATVLEGAMETIVKGKVDIVSFEYHEVGVWREYSLKNYVDKLDGIGYVCYMDGKPTLSRMTGCWHDAYEAYAWSNVVCIPRKHKLYHVAERMTTRYESPSKRAKYFQDIKELAAAQAGGAGSAAGGADATS